MGDWELAGGSRDRGIGRSQTGRWAGWAAALLTAAALSACGSSGSSSSANSTNGGSANKASTSYGTSLYGSLPPAGTPVSGGTISIAQLTGQTPLYIFPIVPAADTSTSTINLLQNLYIPIYAGPLGARPEVNQALSAAEPPVWSNNDTTVSITIKPGLKWSNGAPVDANDMAFAYYLLKAALKESPANWGQYSPYAFPTNVVSVSVPSAQTIVFKLNKPTNPGWFLYNNLQTTDNVYPLPSTAWNIAAPGGPHLDFRNPDNAKKIYDFLNKEGSSIAGFATNPLWQVVDGPYKLKSFNATNSSYTLVPNPGYGLSPKPTATVNYETFTGATAQLNAFKSGAVDLIGLDPTQLAQAPALRAQGASVFGGPGWGWFGAIINFKDHANDFNNVIAQLYVRQAIAHLINEPQIIAGVYHGAAVPAYGPVASAPSSPYSPPSATTPPYPFSPSAAVALLKSHGWNVVPNGTTTCAKPGTGAGECGAGIPKGTPITFVWGNVPESISTSGVLESEALGSEAKSVAGINIQFVTKTFNFLNQNFNDTNPAAAKFQDQWGVNNSGGLYLDYNPTQLGVEVPPGSGFDYGDYSNPAANALVHASITSSNPSAVNNEMQFWATNLPVWYWPSQDNVYAVSSKLGGNPLGFLAMTQQSDFPQYLWQRK